MHFMIMNALMGFHPVSEIYKKLKFFPWEFSDSSLKKILGSGDSRDPHFKIGILRSSVLTLGL